MITFTRKPGTLLMSGMIYTGIWSGFESAKNDPTQESKADIGPLPAGIYEIGAITDDHKLGPRVMPLKQIFGESYGRSGFYIHGDSVGDVDWTASHGCIIAPRNVRDLIDAQTDRRIRVV